MIPLLTIDENSIRENWKRKVDQAWVKRYCDVYVAKDNIPLYYCDDTWVNMGVFKEYKKTISPAIEYGYCDTEVSLIKYLQQFKDDKENNFFVSIGGLDMDYEKYYKFGSYINKDGVDTRDDYYSYIDKHPEMQVKQDMENCWIKFIIYKL